MTDTAKYLMTKLEKEMIKLEKEKEDSEITLASVMERLVELRKENVELKNEKEALALASASIQVELRKENEELKSQLVRWLDENEELKSQLADYDYSNKRVDGTPMTEPKPKYLHPTAWDEKYPGHTP